MVDYVDMALRANADKREERRLQEAEQRGNEDAVIAEFEATHGPVLSARLAETLGGAPSDSEFTSLSWRVHPRPVVERRDGAYRLRPHNSHHPLYLETTFQGVRVQGHFFGEHNTAAGFAVVSTNGGMTEGFGDLARFGAAVQDVRRWTGG